MPIYEYGCKDCEHTEEIYFKKPINEVVDPKECPKCKSENYNRLMSGFMPEVPNGKMYLGKRDWKKNLTTEQKADVYLGKNPY